MLLNFPILLLYLLLLLPSFPSYISFQSMVITVVPPIGPPIPTIIGRALRSGEVFLDSRFKVGKAGMGRGEGEVSESPEALCADLLVSVTSTRAPAPWASAP